MTDNVVQLDTLLPSHPGLERVESMLEAAMTGKALTENIKETPWEAGKAAVTETATTDTDRDFDDGAAEILADIRKRRQK